MLVVIVVVVAGGRSPPCEAGDTGMGTGEGVLAIRIGDTGTGDDGEGVFAIRILIGDTGGGSGSVEKYICTGPTDVNRSCAVDA